MNSPAVCGRLGGGAEYMALFSGALEGVGGAGVAQASFPPGKWDDSDLKIAGGWITRFLESVAFREAFDTLRRGV